MGLKQLLFTAGVISIILLYGFGGAYGAVPDLSGIHQLRSFSDHTGNFQEESLNRQLNVQDVPDSTHASIRAEEMKSDILEGTDGGVWQNITMPAVITVPGKYRIINNYFAAPGADKGIIVNSSHVLIDGNGHTFSGNDLPGSVGVQLMGNDTAEYDHISIRNLSLVNSSIGIQCAYVERTAIINTTHTGNYAGIDIRDSQRVVISNYAILDGKGNAPGGGAILANDTGNLIIVGGTIRNSYPDKNQTPEYGIFLENESGPDNLILGNEISGQRAAAIRSVAVEANKSCNLLIINNTISGPAGYGIDTLSIDPDSHVSIAWNTISGCGNGMAVAADNSFVIENQVNNSGLFGILMEAQHCWISGNIMTNNPACLGMYGDTIGYYLHTMFGNIADGRPVLYIKNETNVTVGPEDDPAMVIVAQCRNVTIHDIATAHAGSGNLLFGVDDLHVSNVRDSGSWEGMVLLEVEGGDVRNCSAERNEFGHAAYNCKSLKFSNCSDSGAGLAGLTTYGSEGTTIDRCTVENITPAYPGDSVVGILSQDSTDLTIRNASVTDSAGQGILLSNTSRAELSGISILKSGLSGLVSDNSSGIILNKSMVKENQHSGFNLLNSANITLDRNFIVENSGPGIGMTSVSDSLIADNFLNNTVNSFFTGNNQNNRWNTTLTAGENIVNGPYLGGNFWATPDGTGFSQTHADRGDGICNGSNVLAPGQIDYLPLAEFLPPLGADFTSDITYGTPPLTVRFQDNTTGEATRWNWSFGDGKRSTEQNPVHVYTGIGRYTVTLEVSGLHGEQGAVRKAGFIRVNNGRVAGPNGMIWISSSPTGARVYVDGVCIGETPLQSTGIPAGIHQVRVSSDGYHDWTGYVQVNHGVFTYIPKVILVHL